MVLRTRMLYPPSFSFVCGNEGLGSVCCLLDETTGLLLLRQWVWVYTGCIRKQGSPCSSIGNITMSFWRAGSRDRVGRSPLWDGLRYSGPVEAGRWSTIWKTGNHWVAVVYTDCGDTTHRKSVSTRITEIVSTILLVCTKVDFHLAMVATVPEENNYTYMALTLHNWKNWTSWLLVLSLLLWERRLFKSWTLTSWFAAFSQYVSFNCTYILAPI